jgi:transcriptional/translational regulatory protein YebC/TACO1
MNDIVRDALENESKDTVESDESSDIERTPDDYTNFKNFMDTNNKEISDTDRESIAEMYGFK